MIAILLFTGFVQAAEPQASWVKDPLIASCHKKIDVQVAASVQFWNALGYELMFVDSERAKQICQQENFGSLVPVRIDDTIDAKRAAETTTQTIGNVIILANVRIHSDFQDNQLVINHEIGHVLGFNHVNKAGHLMHKSSTFQGNDITGLRKKNNQ